MKNKKLWPIKVDCNEYGILVRVYLKSDESWSCQYRRVQDGRYFTPEARHIDNNGSFKSYFTKSDSLYKENKNV